MQKQDAEMRKLRFKGLIIALGGAIFGGISIWQDWGIAILVSAVCMFFIGGTLIAISFEDEPADDEGLLHQDDDDYPEDMWRRT